MKLKTDKRWEYLSLDQSGWWLYERMPSFLHNCEWWTKAGGRMYVAEGLFDLPESEFGDEPKLFKRKRDDWIEISRKDWETNSKRETIEPKISIYWQFLAGCYCYGWELYKKEPTLHDNHEWLGKHKNECSNNIELLFDDLPMIGPDGEPQLFKHEGNKWIEVPKDQWKYEEA